MAQERDDEIATLLQQAGLAHHRYERDELKGGYDQDWARWYAGYLVEQGIGALLGHVVTVSQIMALLLDCDTAYQQAQPSESWEQFAARRMQQAM